MGIRDFFLTDKVAFIADTRRGLGRAMALVVADAGADVVVTDVIDNDELRDVARELPRVVRKRRHLRRLRRLADRNVLSAEPLTAPRALLERKLVRVGLKVLSSGFRLYWALVYPFLGRPAASNRSAATMHRITTTPHA